jgi:hypothetical protein
LGIARRKTIHKWKILCTPKISNGDRDRGIRIKKRGERKKKRKPEKEKWKNDSKEISSLC